MFKVSLAGLTSPLVREALSCGPAVEKDQIGAEDVLRMIMDALVDDYRLAEEATAGSFAVEMEKRIA